MMWAENSLADGKRLIEERFGLRILPLHVVDAGQARQAVNHAQVPTPERLLEDLQGAFVECFGRAVLALSVEDKPQARETLRETSVLWSEFLCLPDSDAQPLLRFAVLRLLQRLRGSVHR